MVFASFLLALSTLRKCNLTVKTQVFSKIFTSSVLSLLFIILSRGDFKKCFKISLQRVPKPFQNALRYHMRLGNPSGTGLERFWPPKWLPKRGPWGVLEALKNVFFSAWPPRTPPEWILDPIWIRWGWILNFSETLLAWKFNPTCVCHFCFALHFVELQMHWSSKSWYPFETSFLQSRASQTKG